MVRDLQVIGLDGCDPILLEKWIKEGVLPTFSEIVKVNVSAPSF